MTPDEEITALRRCVRELWEGMNPCVLNGNHYWTDSERQPPFPHAAFRHMTETQREALAAALDYSPEHWRRVELKARGVL